MSIKVKTSKSEVTKKTIFEASKSLIKTNDFNKVTVRMICTAAQISIGTFYIYYKTKFDVLLTVYEDVDQLFTDAHFESMTDITATEKIMRIISIQMDFTTSIDVQLSQQLYSSHIFNTNELLVSEDRVFFQTLNAIVLDGQNDDSISKRLSSKAITWKILRFCRGIIFDWLSHKSDYDLKKVALEDLSDYLQVICAD